MEKNALTYYVMDPCIMYEEGAIIPADSERTQRR